MSDFISSFTLLNEIVRGRAKYLDGVSAAKVFLGDPAVVSFVQLNSNLADVELASRLIPSLLTHPFNKVILSGVFPALIDSSPEWNPEQNLSAKTSEDSYALNPFLNELSNEVLEVDKPQWRVLIFRSEGRLSFLFK